MKEREITEEIYNEIKQDLIQHAKFLWWDGFKALQVFLISIFIMFSLKISKEDKFTWEAKLQRYKDLVSDDISETECN